MRPLAVLLSTLLLAGCARPSEPPPVPSIPVAAGPGAGSRLRALLDTLRGPARVVLDEGRYVLEAVPFTDPSCGNCEDPSETVPATRGLRLSGRGVTLEGAGADVTVVETRAGYGVLFDGCDGCVLRALTVTGGVRDPDGRATDGGVVVRDGRVRVEECAIRDNLGDSAVVHGVIVGVGGVMVRERAEVVLRRCRILRNSWDGVALYRAARATVEENTIDGVDAASGARHGGGRGVGIGLTWDATATVVGNRVARYWKGIGVFVNASAEVRENVVEDVLTWGVAYWAAGEGSPRAWIERNAVYRTGACGASIERTTPAPAGEDPGHLVDNAFVETGRDARYDTGEPYCFQRPVARHAVPAGFEVERNLVHGARQPGDAWPHESVVRDRGRFEEALRPLVDALRRHPPLLESRFLSDFGGG